MPKIWYVYSENCIKDGDSDEVIAQKTLNQQLCAHKKPYFFGYNYPTLKQEYDKYVKETDEHVCSVTGKSIHDLLKNDANLSENEQKILDYYKKHLPLDISPSTMNRICWAIEDKFDNVDDFANVDFDYSIYKAGIEYSIEDYELVKLKCEEYKNKKRDINKKRFADFDDGEDDAADQLIKISNELEEACYSICPNEQLLCEMLIDICYRDGFDTGIVWGLCGDVLVDKIASKSGMLSYPAQDSDGEFWCCGAQFSMKNIVVGGEDDD